MSPADPAILSLVSLEFSRRFRFGGYLFNPLTGELTKGNTPIRLQEQPALILAHLLERSGKLITRQELQDLLWPDGTNVDFESGLNSAVRRLRQALLDEAERPRYIETIPKRGYRFVAAVEIIEPDSVPEVPSAQPLPQPLPPPLPTALPAPGNRRWFLAASAVALAGAAGAAWKFRRPASRQPSVHTSIVLPPEQQIMMPNGHSLAISLDGDRIVYLTEKLPEKGAEKVAEEKRIRQLYVRPLSGTQAELIPQSDHGECPVVLPAPNSFAWTTTQAVHLSQAGKHSIADTWDVPATIKSLRITQDGDLLFLRPKRLEAGASVGLSSTCHILRRGQSKPDLIPIPFGGQGIEMLVPQDLWEGRYLLYSSILGPQLRTLNLMDLTSGRRKMLASPAMGGRLLAQDQLLYFWGGNLLLAQWDREEFTLRSEPRVVASGIAAAAWVGPEADLAANGTLVYCPERPLTDWKPMWVGLDGTQSPLPIPPGPYLIADLSADSRFLLLVRRHSGGLGTLLRYDLETGATKELAKNVEPRACWGPGARQVALSRHNPGEWLATLEVMDVETGRTEWRLPFQGFAQYASHWNEATNEIYFVQGYHPRNAVDIGVVSAREGKSPRLLVEGIGVQNHPRLSPNGQLLVYCHNYELRVRSLHGGSTEVSLPGQAIAPLWSPDGRTIYFRSGRAMKAVDVNSSSTGISFGPPRKLFEGDYIESTQWSRNVFFSAKRQAFLLALPGEEPEPPRRIDVVTNWLNSVS